MIFNWKQPVDEGVCTSVELPITPYSEHKSSWLSLYVLIVLCWWINVLFFEKFWDKQKSRWGYISLTYSVNKSKSCLLTISNRKHCLACRIDDGISDRGWG
jgi:hypothetical protein